MQPPYHQQPLLVKHAPSPWWYWGVAIFVGLMVALNAVSAIFTALIPYDLLIEEIAWTEDPGAYPENGTTEDQDSWNASKEEWDIQQKIEQLMVSLEDQKPLQLTLAAVMCTLGIASVILLAQQKQSGFKFSFIWIAVSTVAQLTQSLQYHEMMTGIYAADPGYNSNFEAIQLGSQIGGIFVCNILLLVVLVACAVNAKGPEPEESGFHQHDLKSTNKR